MSEPRSKSPQDGENGQSALHDDKPRLTEEEKKQNHIASEQKRREAIRAGFDRLCELVPGLEGHGRSEGFVLKETVKYMREQLARRRRLRFWRDWRQNRGTCRKELDWKRERGHDPDDDES
ncbi:hypothetical protein F4776DRAFT_659896 [Hypoxylon sp. NC0597]|nr:hypothetical protein F4776DRAFT_659896 [Hypoxylon sp. NC0597]